MVFPLVTECARDAIAVTVSCRMLGFSRQAYYRWLADSACQRDWYHAHLTNRLVDAHADDPAFGYRLLADEVSGAGKLATENWVHRLCRDQKLASTTVRRQRDKGRPGPAVHDDLVRRDFRAAGPDRVWLTDITELPTAEGKGYLCAIKDVLSRRIVGWATSDRMTSRLAAAALRTAIARRRPTGTVIVSSDRDGQFRSRRYQRTVKAHGLLQSMGRVASAGEIAAVESHFALLQNNVLGQQAWKTREDLTVVVISCIVTTYHRRRRQRGLGRMTPIEFAPAMVRHTAIAA